MRVLALRSPFVGATLALLAALSSFSFVRGALTGLALASAVVWTLWQQRRPVATWTSHLSVVTAAVLPGLISAALIAK